MIGVVLFGRHQRESSRLPWRLIESGDYVEEGLILLAADRAQDARKPSLPS